MSGDWDRRGFLQRVTVGGLALGALGPYVAAQEDPHRLPVLTGKPHERGRQYGLLCKEPLKKFLDQEFGKVLAPESKVREKILRHLQESAEEIQRYSPAVMEELRGIAAGSGLTMDEVLLTNGHEELRYHGLLPKVEHCAALAAAPPDTNDGNTYVGQSYEWGWACRLFLWKRTEGPSVIGYTYPGLLPSVGLNSAGVALCATSAGGGGKLRAGIPYYVLSTQMLFQDTLGKALDEARRAKHAGWCTMILGDPDGQLANVEPAQEDVAVELHRGHLARHNFGSRRRTATPEGKEVVHNARTKHIYDLLSRAKGKLNREALQSILEDPGVKGGPINLMLFNLTKREVHFTVGGSGPWRRYGFDE